jgi:hypothetical protein
MLINYNITTSNTRKDLLTLSKVIVNSFTRELVFFLVELKNPLLRNNKKPFRQACLVPNIGKSNHPDYKAPVPFFPETEDTNRHQIVVGRLCLLANGISYPLLLTFSVRWFHFKSPRLFKCPFLMSWMVADDPVQSR